MLRNRASGPEIGLPGRILAGLLPGKNRNRPSFRPEGRFLCFPGSSPAKIRPRRPIYGPEARLRNLQLPIASTGAALRAALVEHIARGALPWRLKLACGEDLVSDGVTLAWL